MGLVLSQCGLYKTEIDLHNNKPKNQLAKSCRYSKMFGYEGTSQQSKGCVKKPLIKIKQRTVCLPIYFFQLFPPATFHVTLSISLTVLLCK